MFGFSNVAQDVVSESNHILLLFKHFTYISRLRFAAFEVFYKFPESILYRTKNKSKAGEKKIFHKK